jgi:hypothetical protein
MSASEKFILAGCLLLVIFLSTNAMLLPLLRGRKAPGKGDKPRSEWQVVSRLLHPPGSKDTESMEELSRQVEQLKGGRPAPPAAPEDGGNGEEHEGRGAKPGI